MEFDIKILLISFFISVILGIIIIPVLKKLKVGQIERDDGPKSHLKKQGTPTMGRNYHYIWNDNNYNRYLYSFSYKQTI